MGHLQTGAIRSGEGSRRSALERERIFEESEMLYDLEESREVVPDMHV
jgi:hypothetical protein